MFHNKFHTQINITSDSLTLSFITFPSPYIPFHGFNIYVTLSISPQKRMRDEQKKIGNMLKIKICAPNFCDRSYVVCLLDIDITFTLPHTCVTSENI